VPYSMRNMREEIKARGGRFDPETKSWSLPASAENQALADQIATPPPRPKATPEERIKTVAQTAADLLNGLKVGTFRLVEVSPRKVVIEGGVEA
jgi:hypothetical protein